MLSPEHLNNVLGKCTIPNYLDLGAFEAGCWWQGRPAVGCHAAGCRRPRLPRNLPEPSESSAFELDLSGLSTKLCRDTVKGEEPLRRRLCRLLTRDTGGFTPVHAGGFGANGATRHGCRRRSPQAHNGTGRLNWQTDPAAPNVPLAQATTLTRQPPGMVWGSTRHLVGAGADRPRWRPASSALSVVNSTHKPY